MKKLSTGNIVLISIGTILVFFLLWIFSSYNNLVKLKENVNSQNSNISTQLQRRSDLIPNLVSTVKGYTSHESKILSDIANSRANLAGASTIQEKAQADSQLTSALSRLLMVVENYPNLKADGQFSDLMDELSGTENRITFARKDYNNSVENYNQTLKTFPTVILGNIFGFSQAEYFKASEESSKVPSVSFE